MYTTIQKWGGSQGVRIPKNIMEMLGLRENDKVEIKAEDGAILIRKASITKHKTVEERLEAFYLQPIELIMPAAISGEYDWGKAVGDEV